MTEQEARKIAVQKMLELIDSNEADQYGVSWGTEGSVFCLSCGKGTPSKEFRESKTPYIDETTPWETLIDVKVNMKTGEVFVKIQHNVTVV